MCENFDKAVLKIAVAQICHSLGWHSVQRSTHEVLTDVLERYLKQLSRTTVGYCQNYSRTIPNLTDVSLAFDRLGILLPELEDYINQVEQAPLNQLVPQYPLPKKCLLKHPINGERFARSEFYDEHLPPLVKVLLDEENEESQDAQATTEEKHVEDDSISKDRPPSLTIDTSRPQKRQAESPPYSPIEPKRLNLGAQLLSPELTRPDLKVTTPKELTPVKDIGNLKPRDNETVVIKARETLEFEHKSMTIESERNSSFCGKENENRDQQLSVTEPKAKIMRLDAEEPVKQAPSEGSPMKDENKLESDISDHIEDYTESPVFLPVKIEPVTSPKPEPKVEPHLDVRVEVSKISLPVVSRSSPSKKSASPKVRKTASPKIGSPSSKLGSPLQKLGSPSSKKGSPSPKLGVKSPKLGSPPSKVSSASPKLTPSQPKSAFEDILDAIREKTEKSKAIAIPKIKDKKKEVKSPKKIKKQKSEGTKKAKGTPTKSKSSSSGSEAIFSPPESIVASTMATTVPKLVLQASVKNTGSSLLSKGNEGPMKFTIKQEPEDTKSFKKTKSKEDKPKPEKQGKGKSKKEKSTDDKKSEKKGPKKKKSKNKFLSPKKQETELKITEDVKQKPKKKVKTKSPMEDSALKQIVSPLILKPPPQITSPISDSMSSPEKIMSSASSDPASAKKKKVKKEKPGSKKDTSKVNADKANTKKTKKDKLNVKTDKPSIKTEIVDSKNNKSDSKKEKASKQPAKDKCKNTKKKKKEDKGTNEKKAKIKQEPDVEPPIPKLTLVMGSTQSTKQSSKTVPKLFIKPTSPSTQSSQDDSDNPFAFTDTVSSPEPVKKATQPSQLHLNLEPVQPTPPQTEQRGVFVETIATTNLQTPTDQVWYCPACNRPDDGSPMIGCDSCDGWYHWPCVGITVAPKDDDEWYCPTCLAKQTKKTKKKRKKKE